MSENLSGSECTKQSGEESHGWGKPGWSWPSRVPQTSPQPISSPGSYPLPGHTRPPGTRGSQAYLPSLPPQENEPALTLPIQILFILQGSVPIPSLSRSPPRSSLPEENNLFLLRDPLELALPSMNVSHLPD